MKGLEPPRPESLDPKSNAATNYATCAFRGAKLHIILCDSKFFLHIRQKFKKPCGFDAITSRKVHWLSIVLLKTITVR